MKEEYDVIMDENISLDYVLGYKAMATLASDI